MYDDDYKAMFDRIALVAGSDKPAAMAKELDVTPQSISHFKKTKKFPPDLIIRYCIKNKVSLDWMFQGIGERSAKKAEYALAESEKNGDKVGEVPGAELEAGKDIKKADRSPVKAAAVSYIDAMSDYEASRVVNYILFKQVPETDALIKPIEDSRFDFLKNLTPEGRKELLVILDRRIEQATEHESLSDARTERKPVVS